MQLGLNSRIVLSDVSPSLATDIPKTMLGEERD
jgi:hypothetical protein